ncbi:hypothetical protein TNCT_111211 [Trichonephila clavata]|uniref:Uncharacterized protein n=1 Tax=Trichonephila clavata TaxID=2740835 RepID=A0A8X6H204_TRICU|nr:hypothetical protein TNCT_111211 [Trichonephila clavata]
MCVRRTFIDGQILISPVKSNTVAAKNRLTECDGWDSVMTYDWLRAVARRHHSMSSLFTQRSSECSALINTDSIKATPACWLYRRYALSVYFLRVTESLKETSYE